MGRLGSISNCVPAGTLAILSRTAAGRSAQLSCSRAYSSGWMTSSRPNPRATASTVTSSCVGPTPPVVST